MCRLYGLRSHEPTKVEHALVQARNALLAQSRCDLGGEAHPDGWGIGVFNNGAPEVERGTSAAFEDEHFNTAAERVLAPTVLAHVRQATVGELLLTNTQPFVFGRWMFAHNGTITAFELVRPLMEEELEPELRGHCGGTTDSELYFFWLLSRAMRAGLDLEARSADAGPLADVIAEALPYLDAACEHGRPEKPARLNVLLTDGHVLVAARWRLSLHWHVRYDSGPGRRAVIVASEPTASEPTSGQAWAEVPDGGVVAVNADLGVEVRRP